MSTETMLQRDVVTPLRESRIPSTKIRERFPFSQVDCLDPADDDRMIAGRIRFGNTALDISESAFENGHACCPGRIVSILESVRMLGSEAFRMVFLMLGQDVHREVASLLQAIVN